MVVLKRLAITFICALVYYWCFYLNKFIFDSYEFSFGVNWVFIPSGLKLVMVLVALEEAAIGIAIASCLIGFENYYLDSMIRTLITGVISGGSPLLAKKVCLHYLGIDRDLLKITFKSILIMSVIFSLISATLHQLWFFYNGVTDQFIHSLAVMAIGDLLGTLIVLSFISCASAVKKRFFNPRL